MSDEIKPICPACSGAGTDHIHQGTCRLGRIVRSGQYFCSACAWKQEEIVRLRAALKDEYDAGYLAGYDAGREDAKLDRDMGKEALGDADL